MKSLINILEESDDLKDFIANPTISRENKTKLLNELTNQSLLLAARGRGELYKGQLTARTEYYKAAGSLLSTANDFDLI